MFYKSFKHYYLNVNVTNIARKHKSVEIYGEANAKVLKEMFDFSDNYINYLMHHYKRLHTKETSELIESYQFCQKMGFTNEVLKKYPLLFLSHPVIHYQHSYTFQDAGIKPDAPLICSSAAYFQKRITVLKTAGYLQPQENIVDNFLSCLNPPIKKPNQLKGDLDKIDKLSFSGIHKIILNEWLKKRLKINDSELQKLLRIHLMIKNKSFTIINENLTIAESIGLGKEKILKCGYVLNNYPEYPKTMLRDDPYFLGIDFATAYKNNPKLMMINPRRIREIYAILKDYEISDDVIRNEPNVFTLSPITLKNRLNTIRNIPEFKVLINDPRMMKLVMHHKKAVMRLSYLKKLKLRCASLNHISLPCEEDFISYIQEGKDINSRYSAIVFFSSLLDKNKKDVNKILTKHPYYYYVPFVDINSTFQYLTMAGYTKENIGRSLLILLYPDSKIHTTISQLKEEQDLQFKNLSQYKQLQLVLYRIEREYHFTGKGIWSNKQFTDQMDEKLLE